MSEIYSGQALVSVHPLNSSKPIVLYCSDSQEELDYRMSLCRANYTAYAAMPGLPEDDYDNVMRTIRGLRFTHVIVTEVEVL